MDFDLISQPKWLELVNFGCFAKGDDDDVTLEVAVDWEKWSGEGEVILRSCGGSGRGYNSTRKCTKPMKARAILSPWMDTDVQSHGTLRYCIICSHTLMNNNCWYKDVIIVSGEFSSCGRTKDYDEVSPLATEYEAQYKARYSTENSCTWRRWRCDYSRGCWHIIVAAWNGLLPAAAACDV